MTEVDISEYLSEERVAFLLLKKKDSIDTDLIGINSGELPTNIANREAYDSWLEMVSEGGDCFYDLILLRGSDEIVSLKTSKAKFYRDVNSLIGPTEDDREEAKKFWHTFVRNNLNANKLKKKAFLNDKPEISKPKKSELDSHRFQFFRPFHQYIIQMYGKMFTSKEIRDFLLEDHGINVSVSVLQAFYKFHESIITKEVSSFKESFDDVRLGYKRSRLEEYAWLYHNLKKDFKDPKTPLHKKTAFSKEMQSCLKAIKDEVEGDTIKIEANVNVSNTINAYLTQKILDRKTVAIVAVARAAMNERIEPAGFLYEMEKSYYAKYNAFLGNDPNDESLALPEQNYNPADYDFDRMDGQVKQQQKLLKQNEDAIMQKRMEMRQQIRDKNVREKLKEALALSKQALSESEPQQEF